MQGGTAEYGPARAQKNQTGKCYPQIPVDHSTLQINQRVVNIILIPVKCTPCAESEMSDALSDREDAVAWTSSSESLGTHRQRVMRRVIYELRHGISPRVEHRADARRLLRHCPYVAPYDSPLCSSKEACGDRELIGTWVRC